MCGALRPKWKPSFRQEWSDGHSLLPMYPLPSCTRLTANLPSVWGDRTEGVEQESYYCRTTIVPDMVE